MDLSRVGYVISICEYDERGKVVLRPDFRGQRLNLYFRDLTDGVGIATEADIEKTCKFSAKWALAARKDPEKAPLVVHCAAGISRSTARSRLSPTTRAYTSPRGDYTSFASLPSRIRTSFT
jgi:predicted protein tyrosine phosphatase